MKICKVVFNSRDDYVDRLKERRGKIFRADSHIVEEKTYHYNTFIEDLKIGDRVVVQARDSYSIGTFIKYTNMFPNETSISNLKLVVDRVDFTTYEKHVEKEEKLEELKAKMENRRRGLEELTLFKMLAESDKEMAEMLNEYTKITQE